MEYPELDEAALKRISDSVGERRGWDFSPVSFRRDPVPWEYSNVARRYLHQDGRMLDIGTGGGEELLKLTPYFGTGVGIDSDPAVLHVARENIPVSLIQKVSFQEMYGEELEFQDGEFDVVLNRLAPVDVEETVRVLRSGGVFVTEQVGPNSTRNICAMLGCTSGGAYDSDATQALDALVEAFRLSGCAITARAEYDVPYWFMDVDSLVFWLKAVPVPEDFQVDKHWEQVQRIVTEFGTDDGIETNDNRELLIVRKE